MEFKGRIIDIPREYPREIPGAAEMAFKRKKNRIPGNEIEFKRQNVIPPRDGSGGVKRLGDSSFPGEFPGEIQGA